MSIYKDGKLIAGGRQCMPLLSFMWADHVLNDASWLRADTFSWQSGAVYQAAYQHLVDDLDAAKVTLYRWRGYSLGAYYYVYTLSQTPNIGDVIYAKTNDEYWPTSGTVASVSDSTITSTISSDYLNYVDSVSDCLVGNTETIAGTTIAYYTAPDGHKICPASEESDVAAIYTATGVAWYYIIDASNQRFKLPRTKFGFTGIRSGVGNYVEAGLPNVIGSTGTGFASRTSGSSISASGAIYEVSGSNGSFGSSSSWRVSVLGIDASRSSSIYGNSDTVQPKATEMYLYFYVGNFTQTALENTAGLNAELFNDKVDVGHEVITFQKPTAGNNYTWYRLYADGWVEIGGIYTVASGSPHVINLPVTMADTNYSISATAGYSGTGDSSVQIHIRTDMITTTTFAIQKQWTSSSGYYYWQVSGMAA